MGECPTFVHAWWSCLYACELPRAHMHCTEEQHKPRGVGRNSPEMRYLKGGMRALPEWACCTSEGNHMTLNSQILAQILRPCKPTILANK